MDEEIVDESDWKGSGRAIDDSERSIEVTKPADWKLLYITVDYKEKIGRQMECPYQYLFTGDMVTAWLLLQGVSIKNISIK